MKMSLRPAINTRKQLNYRSCLLREFPLLFSLGQKASVAKINNICLNSFFEITEAIVAVLTSAVKVSVQWSSDSDSIKSKM